MLNTQVSKTCIICNNSYKVQLNRAETSKYCSKRCWSVRNPPLHKTCPTCGNTFKTYKSQNFESCSQSCARRGKRSNAYKDGRSLFRQRARLAPMLKGWRTLVMKRDNFTCQKCGYQGHELHAHHIKEFAIYPELRFEVSNGLTLCVDCHGAIHGKNFKPVRQYFDPICEKCGTATKGRSRYCRSCSASIHYVNHWTTARK